MLKKIILAFFVSSFAFAQDDFYCSTHSLSNAAREANPELLKAYESLEIKTLAYENLMANAKVAATGTKVIPVVIHIIHDYQNGSNIEDSQVINAIEILNEDFNEENDDLSDVVSSFSGITGDIDIEFRLAKIDPDGNCTNGITRTNSSLTNTAGENVKELIKWPVNKYVNVWVVESIASGAGGYTYTPGHAPPWNNPDGDAGILVLNQQFGGIGSSNGSAMARHTLSHEFGHFFNLKHTWGPTNTPGVATNCGPDDGVSDTPECIGATSCNLTNISCGTLDNVQNFMSYSGCPRMFTVGQKNRMRFVIENGNSGAASRKLLWQSSNLIATGTNDAYAGSECAPLSDFYINKKRICLDTELDFEGFAYNATNVNYEWTFNGATPSTSTLKDPSVVYTQGGSYDVTLKVSNATGQNIKSITNYIIVKETLDFGGAPYINEGFDTDFIEGEFDNAASWDLEPSSNGEGWEVVSIPSAAGGKCIRVRSNDFDNSLEKDQANFYSPVYDFSDFSDEDGPATLYFKRAYSMNNYNGEDRFRVSTSTNCGRTWKQRYSKSADDLATVVGTKSLSWVPADEDWETVAVDLPTFILGKPSILFRFSLDGHDGNFMYIDQIEIHNGGLSVEEMEENTVFEIAPNPANEETMIYIENIQSTESTIYLTDALGREVAQYHLGETLEATVPLAEIKADLKSGLYYVRLSNQIGNITKKIIVL